MSWKTSFLCVLLHPALCVAADTVLVERVSVSTSGVQADNSSGDSVISADGRYIAFNSTASNLIDGTIQSGPGLFIRDRITSTTQRLLDCLCRPKGLSADGRYIVYLLPVDGYDKVYLLDRMTSLNTAVSLSTAGVLQNTSSSYAQISGDGRVVAFSSQATNLVSDDTNGETDVFVRDLDSLTTTRISVTSLGAQANGSSGDDRLGLSYDGRYVVFSSRASNLDVSSTGVTQIYRHDRQTHTTTLISTNAAGVPANVGGQDPTITADGRFVVFTSKASNLVPEVTLLDIRHTYRKDLTTGAVVLISALRNPYSSALFAYTDTSSPYISAEGRFVSFASAGGLPLQSGFVVPDVFRRDHLGQLDLLVSVSLQATHPNNQSKNAGLTSDGSTLLFQSWASDLVNGDTNGVSDIFVAQTQTDECPDDNAKTSPGTCGCGIADNDSDGDGVSDCVDNCPADPFKSSPSLCGCGVPEGDLNANGYSDCLEPTNATVPSAPIITVKGKKITATIPQSIATGYELSIQKQSKLIWKKTIQASMAKLPKLPKGSYSLRYKIIFNAIATQNSPARKFKVR